MFWVICTDACTWSLRFRILDKICCCSSLICSVLTAFDHLFVRKFLLGLQQFGKGDWRSISRNVVITRTPTQVASHAQKYFLRQNSVKKERKRSSIHDITSAETNSVPMSADQNWIPPPGGQPLPLQQLPPTGHMPDQGASLGYQNFSFPM